MAEWIAPAVSQDRQPRSLDEGKGRRCQAGQNFNERARRGDLAKLCRHRGPGRHCLGSSCSVVGFMSEVIRLTGPRATGRPVSD